MGRTAHVTLGALLVVWGGCSQSSQPTLDRQGKVAAKAATTETKGKTPPAKPPAPPPRLDTEGPIGDLYARRYLWHLHHDGLIIPVAGEGFRKYSNEYSSPWRGLRRVKGHQGRVLGSRAARLRFPWKSSEGAVVIRMHGMLNHQRLSVRVNGRAVKNVTLDPGWQVVTAKVPPGTLRQGENSMVVSVGRPPTLFHSIEILPQLPAEPATEQPAAAAKPTTAGRPVGATKKPAGAGPPAAGTSAGKSPVPGKAVAGAERPAGAAAPAGASVAPPWPAASPARSVTVGGKRRHALTGFRRLVTYLEIPRTGWLQVHTGTPGSSARFRVTVRAVAGQEATLLDEEQPPNRWQPRYLSLARFADKLVELELSSSVPEAAWGDPRIMLETASRRPRPGKVRNVILFVGDALRADKLEVIHKTRVRTPRISKAVRAGGIAFRRMLAASPSSPPSHASIQTGMIPRVHGVVGDKAKPDPRATLISGILTRAGVSAGYYGNNAFGMARLQKLGRWTEFHQPTHEGKGADCSALVKEILGFAETQSQAGKRFFVSALAIEPHTPYRYHKGVTEHYFRGPLDPVVGKRPDGRVLGAMAGGKVPLTPERLAQVKGLYDGEVEHMDACFGDLLDGLATKQLLDQTAVILTGDHGEGFFEHQKFGHAFGHWTEVTDVPLVVLLPGAQGKPLIVETVASHLDIVPTILDLMGVPVHPRIQGETLVPVIIRQGPWLPRVVTAEYGRSYSLRAHSWRYIVEYSGKEYLYHDARDPKERQNLLETRPKALRYFRDLAGFFLIYRTEWRMAEWGNLGYPTAKLAEHLDGQ